MARLKFYYCECGCKGAQASAGPLHYWIYNDLRGTFTLRQGHGHLGTKLGEFKSHESATWAANDHAKVEAEKIVEQLQPLLS